MNHFCWTLDRVAEALRHCAAGGFPSGTTRLRQMSTDTRALQSGDCFIALVGDRFDAHTFLDVAVRAGAAALVVKDVPPLDTYHVPVYAVDDTLVALGDLARYWRSTWRRSVIGIAGSNGKTSTKELVRAAIGTTYNARYDRESQQSYRKARRCWRCQRYPISPWSRLGLAYQEKWRCFATLLFQTSRS